MSGSLAAVSLSLLTLVFWLAGRRRVASSAAVAGSAAVAALNRQQISLVRQRSDRSECVDALPDAGAAELAAPLPKRGDARGRRLLLQRLEAQWAAGGRARLLAMHQARRWGDPAVLPLLRRGLRDRDPAVCLEAAGAMQRFRGLPLQPGLPRNVARTL